MSDVIQFLVAGLNASAPDGVPVVWQGRQFDSGPLAIELDEASTSCGRLDYAEGKASAEFHVQLQFPGFATVLEDAGVGPEFTAPLRATLRSEGRIMEDHGFALAGTCEFAPHALLDDSAARMLPGY